MIYKNASAEPLYIPGIGEWPAGEERVLPDGLTLRHVALVPVKMPPAAVPARRESVGKKSPRDERDG